MSKFNITPTDIQTAYQNGLLPQRNNLLYFYQDTSGRSVLINANLSSENRRILKKTCQFNFHLQPINEFNYDLQVLKTCFKWSKQLNWNFPLSSIKNIFTNHIFNYIYTWTDNKQIIAYSVCLFEKDFSHIAYVFYDPNYAKNDLPIRLSLQVVIDSINKGLSYCYLGRFDPPTNIGFYKRNFPNFQTYNYKLKKWQSYQK